MATAKTFIDVQNGKLTMTVLDETVEFKVFESLKFPEAADDCYSVECNAIEVVKSAVQDELLKDISEELLDWVCDVFGDNEDLQQIGVSNEDSDIEEVCTEVKDEINKSLIPSINSPPTLELKQLPSNLKYAFLGENETFPVIIASDLETKKKRDSWRCFKITKPPLDGPLRISLVFHLEFALIKFSSKKSAHPPSNTKDV